MISVWSRDERKGLSLMCGFEGEKMEFETEIEEGEAYDSAIDPDVSLSYIDEKIQDVLGDCQKDFEGGVSAENLGAKFGGYGSFLPAYQRSPVSSYPKTPPISISSNNAHIEVGHQNPVSQSRVSAPRKSKSNSKKSIQEVFSTSGEKSNSVSSFGNDSDPKSLKVRLRVSSDDLSTQRNADIYSGLGLDVSPSSLDTNPVNSDGIFHITEDGPDESPTSILEMMTSFPVAGSLISPLPYDVLNLTEKKLDDSSCGPLHKGSQESTLTAFHGSDLVKVDQSVYIEKSKSKSSEKNSASMESTNGDNICNAAEVVAKKETGVDRKSLGNKSISSSSSKNKKRSNALNNDSFIRKNEKVKETYKDFFGELDLEHEDNDEMALEKRSEDVSVKSVQENNSSSKERLNGVQSDVGAHTVVPVVEEFWVGCDKCEKWRLLPPGVTPSSLPEKWLCSMLDWLPGMNRCSISEEETTKATNSLFLGPQPVHPGGLHLELDAGHTSCQDGTHQRTSSQVPSSGVKKKHGLKDVANDVRQERPSMSSNSSKKNYRAWYKTGSLNGANPSPLVNEPEFQDSGRSHDLIVEKDRLKQDRLKQKGNNKLRENFADGGNNIKTHSSKISNKRERIQDFPKENKKLKMDGNDRTSRMEKVNTRDVSKKRKNVNEIDRTGRYSKETSETNYMKDKKARLTKSINEEKNQEHAKFLDRSRRDNVVAATSSSSKVSGSHKTKTNNHDTKGSPVESVSSSPMRIQNSNKFRSPRRDSNSVDRLTKNADARPRDEKSKGGRHKSKELSLNKNVGNVAVSCQDSKKPLKKDAFVKEKKSNSLPPRGQNEKGVLLKSSKPNKKGQTDNGTQTIISKDPSQYKTNGNVKDSVGVVLVKELPSQATTIALKEATNLKHMADRIKNGGSSTESRALYMQAALKFLDVASLFESSNNSHGGGIVQSMSIYNSTAKLCEFCAHEYERTKELTTAALAYKCMEVAHMKVIFSTHATNCKVVNELQTSLQIGPTGESPSSSPSASVSDIDNMNNPATAGKATALTKGVSVNSAAANHVIVDKNNPNFMRTLNFAQDVITAMDASKKSRMCFAAANNSKEDVLCAVKRVLDFNFHNVEEFLKLVRVAMEVIICN
ncbi:cysteine-tryptophan domain-containing zinc finger protein 7-like [Rutidosis leptorrhynchoides]|uniref:cysteine-tryptophan domain-containing zinc finger protein 7-like n=1 Tax=Rutidosis leptorrhynchoides TaxID=125765 RepID=UPI003A996BA4